MKEMIKKYRGSLICSVLVMLIGVLVGFTSTQSMWANVFFVVTDCALVAIIFYDNRKQTAEPQDYRNDDVDYTNYNITL